MIPVPGWITDWYKKSTAVMDVLVAHIKSIDDTMKHMDETLDSIHDILALAEDRRNNI